MNERVFVATDLSSGADEALRAAYARSRQTGADVAVCYVHSDFFGARSLFAPDNDETRAQLEAIEAHLRGLLAARVGTWMPDLRPELFVAHGSAAASRRARPRT